MGFYSRRAAVAAINLVRRLYTTFFLARNSIRSWRRAIGPEVKTWTWTESEMQTRMVPTPRVVLYAHFGVSAGPYCAKRTVAQLATAARIGIAVQTHAQHVQRIPDLRATTSLVARLACDPMAVVRAQHAGPYRSRDQPNHDGAHAVGPIAESAPSSTARWAPPGELCQQGQPFGVRGQIGLASQWRTPGIARVG